MGALDKIKEITERLHKLEAIIKRMAEITGANIEDARRFVNERVNAKRDRGEDPELTKEDVAEIKKEIDSWMGKGMFS